MSGTYRRDTLWIPYGYRGHMGNVIKTSLIVTLLVVRGVTTNDTLGGGWTEQTPYCDPP